MSDTWKSPGAILGIIAALCLVVSLYFSYVHASTEIQKKCKLKLTNSIIIKPNKKERTIDKKQKLEEPNEQY